MENCW